MIYLKVIFLLSQQKLYICRTISEVVENVPIIVGNLPLRIKNIGGLAHLARALAWQARGGRFESDILHKKAEAISFGLFIFIVLVFY